LNLSPKAKSDLSDIWDFTTERWSLLQARVYVSGLTDVMVLLCDQPEIAPLFSNLTSPVRIYRYRSHVMIFTADDALLEVIRVVHARSNWSALLSD
jgi:toxin ParE1/3/4